MFLTSHQSLPRCIPPILPGAMSGISGTDGLPQMVQALLKQIRRKPQAYKKLLLTLTFHPLPIYSNVRFVAPEFVEPTYLADYVLFSGIRDDQVVDFLDALRAIRDAFRSADKDFREQLEAELRLRKRMFKVTGRLFRDELLRHDGKVSKRLEPFLLATTATAPGFDAPLNQARLGRAFAEKMLPDELTRRLISSAASDGHMTYLARMLGRYAEVLQQKDAAFKQLVEQERTKRKPAARTKP